MERLGRLRQYAEVIESNCSSQKIGPKENTTEAETRKRPLSKRDFILGWVENVILFQALACDF